MITRELLSLRVSRTLGVYCRFKGMSKRELARQLQLTYSRLIGLLEGKVMWRVDDLLLVSRYTGIDASLWFANDEDDSGSMKGDLMRCLLRLQQAEEEIVKIQNSMQKELSQ